MAPPKQETHTYYRERIRRFRCEVCGDECIGKQIVELRHMDKDVDNFLNECTLCGSDVLCRKCWDAKKCCEKKKKAREEKRRRSESSSSTDYTYIFLIMGLILVVILICYKKFSSSNNNYIDLEAIIKDEYRNLKNKYPDQKQGLWASVQTVMHNTDKVTTLTFLYKDDPTTSDCLAEEIAYSYSKIQNRTFSRESIFHADNQVNDFGVVLEEYGLKVEKTNLLIVKHLHEVSGNVARIFHTLCDSDTPKVAPSVYIFTLRYDDRVKNLKPLEKAGTILREAWSDLPEKELHALIARVITLIVEVNPEKTKHC